MIDEFFFKDTQVRHLPLNGTDLVNLNKVVDVFLGKVGAKGLRTEFNHRNDQEPDRRQDR